MKLYFFSGDTVEEVQSSYGGNPQQPESSQSYGPSKPIPKLTRLSDRVTNLEAVTIAFTAENNLPLSAVPKLIQFSQVRF